MATYDRLMSQSVIGHDVIRLSPPPRAVCIASEMLVFATAAPFRGTQLPAPGLGPGRLSISWVSRHVPGGEAERGAESLLRVGHDRMVIAGDDADALVGQVLLGGRQAGHPEGHRLQ